MIVVHTLGTVQIDIGEMRVLPTSPRKFALLLYLSVERGRRVVRTRLQNLIFPDQSEKNAQHSLRELLYQLRQARTRITSNTEGIHLPDDSVVIDLEAFVSANRLTVDQLRAVEGGFLPGYAPEYSEAFTEWLEIYRARSTFELCKALVADVVRSRRVGDWTRTEQAARACLGLDPLNEEATLGLAEALAMGGAKARAIELLDQYAAEVDQGGRRLQLPATMLRRRISERIKDSYRAPLTLPFLGRDAEMDRLSDCFDRVRQGEAHCTVIIGDPGIGKSRLAEEFCARASLDGALVEAVVTQPHDAHRPMGTIADLVPRLLQLPGSLGCSPDSMAALNLLTKPELDEGFSRPATTNSEAVASSITGAVADLIDAIAIEAPLIVLIDDAQWADELSLAALFTLASARRHRRLLVIVTSRDRSLSQRLAQFAERCSIIFVGALHSSSTRDMVSRVLDRRVLGPGDQLREWLSHASGGNPFFLRCLIAHLQLTGERFVVPSSVNALLDQQLAALGQDASVVLGTLVVLGRHSTIERVTSILEITFHRLQLAVRELEMANLIVQQGIRLEPAHWLIAESVARTTSPIALKLLHRRVALNLECHTAFEPASAWDCAEHWILAGDDARASTLMNQCVNYSLEIGRPRAAAETLLRAAALVTGGNRAELVSRAARLGATFWEADIVLRAANFAAQHGVTIAYDGFELDHLLARIVEWDNATAVKDALRPWLSDATEIRHKLRAALVAIIFADTTYDPSFAHEIHAAVADVLQPLADAGDPRALTVLLIFHSRFGDVAESVRLAHRVAAIASTQSAADAANLQRKAAVALFAADAHDEAVAAARAAYNGARASGLVRLQAHMAAFLAYLMIEVGRPEDRHEWLRRLDELADNLDGLRASLTYITALAEIGSALGDARLTREWVDYGKRIMLKGTGPRATRWLRALEIRAQQLEGIFEDSDRVVSSMIDHHLPNAETGEVSDLEISVALESLYVAGQSPQAQELLTRYASGYRRSPGPFTANLRRVAHLIGWPKREMSSTV